MYVIPCYVSSPHHILLSSSCIRFIVCKERTVGRENEIIIRKRAFVLVYPLLTLLRLWVVFFFFLRVLDVDHFKIFIEFVTILLLFHILGFGTWDLSPLTTDETCPLPPCS